MQREILFKARRKDIGLWEEGQIIQISDRYFISDKDYTKIEKSIMFISGEMIYDLKCMYEVFPKTICQYTGLQDKNGVKIFENDLLYRNDKDYGVEKGQVIYDEGIYTIKYKNVYTSFNHTCIEKWKVVGNIFDEEVK